MFNKFKIFRIQNPQSRINRLLCYPIFFYLKILSIIFLSLSVYPQNSDLNFEHFNVDKGLLSSNVPCLFQDRKGYLWFGTFYGIARYDGYSIVPYTHKEGDTTSITNAIVDAICDDSDGNLWVGHARGLDKFNPSIEAFTHYTLNSQMPLTDWSQHVLALHEDRNGVLWIGTGGGLYTFEKVTETFTWIKNDSTDPHSISSNSVNAIYEDKTGTLWFATGKGLNKFDKATNQFVHYWYPTEKFKDITNNNNPYWVLSILEDREGTFWLGTTGGVVEFNLQTEKFDLYQNDTKNSQSLANNTVLSICEDQTGLLWVSTKEGVDLFNKKTKVFSHNKHDEQNPGSLSSNDVGKILLDKSGTIWISTYGAGGVNKFTPPNPLFKYYSSKAGIYAKLPLTSINDLAEDKKGRIWIGTGSGLLKFDPEKETFEQVSNKDIYIILEDRSGSIWYSGFNESLSKIDQRGKERRFKGSFGLEIQDGVTAICNSHDGNIWLGTFGGNVYSLNPVSREVIPVSQKPYLIEAIYEDKSGLLWIGTREAGIICYDPVQKNSTYYTYNPKDSLTLSSNNVTQFCEDKAGNIWIVAGHTLNKYNRAAQRFIRLGEKAGFANNIFHVTEDGSGNLWMSTPQGTVKFNPNTNQFKNYANISGWGFKTKNEELYFISKEGITRFHPDSLKDNPYIPTIVITSFRKFEKPYPFGKTIELDYTENFLSFEFAALNYVNPEKNQYAYKMEGVDKDWVYSGTRRFASYPNLDPGEYVFRVKGSNNDGVWNEAGTSLVIIIFPPWWKTWWAYSTYVLLFVFSLYGIRRYEMNRLKLKDKVKMDEAVLKEKEETEKIKSRFFANISHEFRTPLTLILGPAEKIISDTSDDIKKDANIIKRNSRRLLQLINQLLDLSKLESGKLKLEASKGNIVSFVKGVALSFESLAESKDITLKLLSEKDFIELYFDREKMMKILTNLLSNAFKFTPEEGTVTVSINSKPPFHPPFIKGGNEGGSVEIKIKDTGIGIPQEEIPKLFDRFYQVDSSFTKEHEGTGIGLALTKELVELHHGIISVESKIAESGKKNPGWTEFTINLPLGRVHLKDEEIIQPKADQNSNETTNEMEVPIDEEENLNSGTLADSDIVTDETKTIILIVEDNYDMREYIKESLLEGYIVEEAVNGEQGVRIAEKIIPDLILSDLMMPKMDGNELVRILKNDEKTSHIPIILLTARSGQESKLEGLQTGADDYLTKPFDIKELQARIKNLISIRKKLQEKFSKGEYITKPEDKRLRNIDEKFMNKVNEVIEKHLSEEEFSIEEFSNEAGMSRTQLHRKIKALAGKSPSQYVRTVRLGRAKKMIVEEKGNISEIAYSVGFSSPAYFTRCFKEEFGYPPSDLIN
jgi:signal transduction histidine kinase/ligand-binding sensor domain-containing protein/DNA-binding response OmpR family regulator